MRRERHNIGVVTFPIAEAGGIPLMHLVEILGFLFNKVYVITGNEGGDFVEKNSRGICVVSIRHKLGANIFTRIANFIWTELRISYNLAKLTRHVDLWVFFIGGEHLLLSMLTAKLFKRKVVLALAGTAVKTAMFRKESFIILQVLDLFESINWVLSSKIIVYSQTLMTQHDLKKKGNKVSVAHEHFLDFDKFKMQKPLSERQNLVGYIGRLSEEKGILNFVKAVPATLKGRDELEFFIGGDGPLRDEIERYLAGEILNGKVKLSGWIPHDELFKYLNNLKLLVLPSYTEGLPNIMLEAMACGTPVLATSVGTIPDIIKDEETSFIMENNSPDCIARNIIKALNHPNLEKIAENGRKLMKKEFTHEAAVERYRGILENIRWRKND